MTHDEMIAVIEAHKAGEPVQYYRHQYRWSLIWGIVIGTLIGHLIGLRLLVLSGYWS